MERKSFQAPGHDVEAAIALIKGVFSKRHDVSFVYLHGSFGADRRFRDIDLAVFINGTVCRAVEIEIELETQLSAAIRKWPVDVRLLNTAPLSFRYGVIKNGKPIFVADDDARCDFVEATLGGYFDFSPFRKSYLKETLGIEV